MSAVNRYKITMAVAHHSLKKLHSVRNMLLNTRRCNGRWIVTSVQHRGLAMPVSSHDRNKAADAKLKTLHAEMREKFARLKLAHTKLMVEYGENIIEPQPSSEAWICALEHLDPSDDLALIEYFTFLTEHRKEQEADDHKRKMESEYERLKENENKIMLLSERIITRFCHNNMAYAMMNGPHLVLDMSFNPQLGSRHQGLPSKITADCLRISKLYRQPFHIHICGVHEDRKKIDINVQGIDHIPVTISSGNYLDYYSKEDLVYLTSDADRTLQRFSYDDVYIIGGLADFIRQQLTYEKAKKDGVRMARLPLELINVSPSTELTAQEVFQILLTAGETNSDWHKAFSHITSLKKQALRD